MLNDTLQLTMPDDWHVHFRSGELMRSVLPYTAMQFGRALVMPNTDPAIRTAEDIERYRNEVLSALRLYPAPHFQPLFTIKLTGSTTRKTIREAAMVGCVAAKLYPTGATTNSEDGIELTHGIAKLIDTGVLHEMAKCNMILCVHAENPAQEVLIRERMMIKYLADIRRAEHDLKIVVEHVSTAFMANYIYRCGGKNMAATITAHHLYLTLDDLVGGMLMPHYFCKPVVKQEADREALWRYLEVCDRFFFGSDSAPHAEHRKESDCCAAGVFTSPILLPLLVKMFEDRGLLNVLEEFLSVRGANFYGLPVSDRKILLEKHKEPQELFMHRVGGCRVMPMRDDDHLYWRVVA